MGPIGMSISRWNVAGLTDLIEQSATLAGEEGRVYARYDTDELCRHHAEGKNSPEHHIL